MNTKEIETLKTLLNKYFDKEFDMYRKAYALVYNDDRGIEDHEPRNLFHGVICTDHPFQNFLEKMSDDIMDHILDVFILEEEPHRFSKDQ